METIDLAATTAQALKLLSNRGMSKKRLHAYTNTGFGCVTRHFRAMGIICVSPEMLDRFLLEQRELFEQGMFSVRKWRPLRRSCELLKYCAAKNSVEFHLYPFGCSYSDGQGKVSGKTHQPQNNLPIPFLR